MYSVDVKPFSTARDDGKIQPPYIQRGYLDYYVNFSCLSLWTRWLFDGIGLPKDESLRVSGNILTIYPVESRHAGNYSCYGTYSNSHRHFLATSKLKVYGKQKYLNETEEL